MPNVLVINLADKRISGENVAVSLTQGNSANHVTVYQALSACLRYNGVVDSSVSTSSSASASSPAANASAGASYNVNNFDTIIILAHGLSHDVDNCYYETLNKDKAVLCSAQQLARFLGQVLTVGAGAASAVPAPREIILAICYAGRLNTRTDHSLLTDKNAFRQTFAAQFAISLGLQGWLGQFNVTAYIGAVHFHKNNGTILVEDEFSVELSAKNIELSQELITVMRQLIAVSEVAAEDASVGSAGPSSSQSSVAQQALEQTHLRLNMQRSELAVAINPQADTGRVLLKFRPGKRLKIHLRFQQHPLHSNRSRAEALAYISIVEAALQPATRQPAVPAAADSADAGSRCGPHCSVLGAR